MRRPSVTITMAILPMFLPALISSMSVTSRTFPGINNNLQLLEAHPQNFIREVEAWLSLQNRKYQRSPTQFTTSSTMIELPVNETTIEQGSIGLHLLPTPTRLEDCRGPRDLLHMTERCLQSQRRSFPASIDAKSFGDEQLIHYSKVIHLHQDVWEQKPEIVKARLLAQIGVTARRLFARKTQVRKIPKDVAQSFLQEHHLWGATQAKYSYGLFYTNTLDDVSTPEELVAVATFTKGRKVERGDQKLHFQSHELLRYCSQRDMSVVGGISKLIKAFIRNHNPDDLVTVVDRDWGDGSGWHSVGFSTVTTTDPIVMAVNPKEPGTRRHLVGAGIGTMLPSPTTAKKSNQAQRLGLPSTILEELDQVNITAENARSILARHNFFLVYDAGVERLFRPLRKDAMNEDDDSSPIELWNSSRPKYAEQYYSQNHGISALLSEASAAVEAPVIKPDWLASWRTTSGSASLAKLIFSAPSSLDSMANVEVRERANGWRTVALVGGTRKSIYHSVYKINPATGGIEPEAVTSDYITIMANSFLALWQLENDIDSQAQATRLLHLGLGGGTLLRLLEARLLSNCFQKALDLDTGVVAAFEFVTPSSPSVEPCVGDALTIQREASEPAWNAIFLDVFDESLRLPPSFYSFEYLQHLRDNMLDPVNGMVFMNLHSGGTKREEVIDEARITFSQVFSTVRMVLARDSRPNGGNTILIGCCNSSTLTQMELEEIVYSSS